MKTKQRLKRTTYRVIKNDIPGVLVIKARVGYCKVEWLDVTFSCTVDEWKYNLPAVAERCKRMLKLHSIDDYI